MTTRFLELMQSHGLGSIDIVDVMADAGFTLSALGDPPRLASLLTPDVLTGVARQFCVRPEWIAGSEDQVLPSTRWTPDMFSDELEAAHRAQLHPSVTLVRAAHADRPDSDDAAAVVRREHVVNSTQFVTLQVWRFNRWITDASTSEQLNTITAVCRGLATPLSGIEVAGRVMHELVTGTVLPAQTLSCLLPRRWEPSGPWDYAGAAVTPTRHANSESFASSEPATTIDLYASLAQQQKPRANN